MGLKTNKTTKTSKLHCQYVGSFSVQDGDQKLSTAEQKRFVDVKLKSCKKKVLDGMPVCLRVSPDGIEVLTSDEKSVKMAHTLRRVSYATVEATHKIFAYVSHQPGTDMEVVCHTFITKKKDHAEGLSAALGKLFKQAFACTLKRRDKLDEAAEKRGGNRRWAKQQVVEGHGGAGVKNARNAKPKPTDGDEQRKENGVASRSVGERPNEGTAASASNTNDRPRRRSSPAVPNTSFESDSPFSNTSALGQQPPRQVEPHASQAQPPASQAQPPARQAQPPPRQAQPPARQAQPPPRQAQPPPRQARQPVSPTLPQECETPFVPSPQPVSPSDDSPFALSFPTRDENQPPALPTRARPNGTSTLPRSPWASVEADIPPELPSRNPPRRSSTPGSPGSNVPPPALVKRYSSDSSIGFGQLCNDGLPFVPRRDPRVERQLSGPPDLMPTSPTRGPVRPRLSSDSSVDSFLTQRSVPQDLHNAAAVFLAGADNDPTPVPRKGRLVNQPSLETEAIPEEVIEVVEDEQLRRGVRNEPRVSLTLEDEDWYIPGVAKETVLEMLETSDIGAFFVRDSQSYPGCYALTMKVVKGPNNPIGFGNYLIAPQGDGFSLQGFDKNFPDISSLIRHYASYDDGLPCRLVLAGSNPLFHDANGYLVEFMDEEDDKYASLSSCRSMFRELNMNDPW